MYAPNIPLCTRLFSAVARLLNAVSVVFRYDTLSLSRSLARSLSLLRTVQYRIRMRQCVARLMCLFVCMLLLALYLSRSSLALFSLDKWYQCMRLFIWPLLNIQKRQWILTKVSSTSCYTDICVLLSGGKELYGYSLTLFVIFRTVDRSHSLLSHLEPIFVGLCVYLLHSLNTLEKGNDSNNNNTNGNEFRGLRSNVHVVRMTDQCEMNFLSVCMRDGDGDGNPLLLNFNWVSVTCDDTNTTTIILKSTKKISTNS